MKKLTSILLALLMALTLLPTAVFADVTLRGNGTANDPYVVSTDTELLEAIGKGGFVRLNNNVTLAIEENAVFAALVKKDLTIDLNGKKLTGKRGDTEGRHVLQVVCGATLTINGTTSGSEVFGRINVGIAPSDRTKANLDADANINGTLILNGGKYHSANNATVLHVNGNTTYAVVTITDAVIESPTDNAIQFSGNGTFTITNSLITGATAIYTKAGTLTVKNSTLKGTLQPANYEYNGNGSNATGDAVVVDSCCYPGGAPNVTFESSTVSGTKAAVGIYEIIPTGKTSSDSKAANVTIKSGEFSAIGAYDTIAVKTDSTSGTPASSIISVSGGTFDDPCALKYAKSGANVTIKLDKNMDENVVVPAGVTATLDLNGFTLNGGTGNRNATITNNGILTITDSSAKKTGTIKREDAAATTNSNQRYYVIENKGEMTIEQANVLNNTGYKDPNPSGEMKGNALICNVGTSSKSAKLTIKNGSFTQENFVVIKNDDFGVLTVDGGTFTSKHSAIQNWNDATLNGGTVNGKIWTAGYHSSSTDFVGKTIINNVNHTGEMVLQAYDDKVTAKPSLEIKGGTFSFTEWTLKQGTDGTAAANKFSISITGGTFAINPKDYVAENYAVTEKTANGATTYTVGKKLADYTAVNAALEKAAKCNGADYTTDSYAKLTAAVDAVVTGKTIDEQAAVTKMATDIEAAIKDLVKRVATNTDNKKNETSSTVNESTTTTTTSGTGANATTTVTHTIDATTSNGNKTTTATVNVPMVVVATMAESANETNNVTVVIKTDVGTITLDKAALKAITANLSSVEGTVTELRMTVKDTTDDDNANHTKRYEVTIEAVDEDGNTTSVYSSSNSKGSATVTVEYTQQNANKRVYVYYVENGVTKERMNATYVDGKLTWTTTHFSTFEVREAYPPRIIHHGGAASSTTTTDKSTSPTTFDAGIAIYGVMAVSSVLGMGYMGKKKFF